MVLRGFERRLEQLVEGSFARAFKSAVQPIEIGRRIVRTMDEERSVGVDGSKVVPNRFVVVLSDDDYARFAEMSEPLRAELEASAREHARSRSSVFVGVVAVSLVADPRRREGRFEVEGSYDSSTGAPGCLVFEDGTRLPIGTRLVIGRLPDCDISIDDPKISRRHAEIVRSVETGGSSIVVLSDLGSTNGTLLNNRPIARHELADGDTIDVGGRLFRFEAS